MWVLWVYVCSRLKRGPGTEARLLAALSVECRVHYLKKKIVSSATRGISLCVGISTTAQSHTTKLVITATVELKFKGAMSDSFHLALYTVSKEKYFLYLIQTPVRHQAVCIWADIQMTNVWRNRRSWGKKRWECIFHSEVSTFALKAIPKPNESESVIVA